MWPEPSRLSARGSRVGLLTRVGFLDRGLRRQHCFGDGQLGSLGVERPDITSRDHERKWCGSGYGYGEPSAWRPAERPGVARQRTIAAGRGLKAGDIVSTGTCTGLDPVQPGDVVQAEFGSLGTVDIRVSAVVGLA